MFKNEHKNNNTTSLLNINEKYYLMFFFNWTCISLVFIVDKNIILPII